jgi:proteic killer suppression protein
LIQSWRTEAARIVFEGGSPKRFPADLLKATRRRLFQINAAERVEDLRSPPGNRLHQLTGDRSGQWSVSVNDQFRICFVWTTSGPSEIEFLDYN